MTTLRDYLGLWLRGVLIVGLTAANVKQIAGGHYLGAFMVGFGISFVWFSNARSAAHSPLLWAREVYAFGAGCGTTVGMLIVKGIYG